MKPAFKTYAAQIVKNAKALAVALQSHEFEIVSGGTDNHMMLVDLTSKGIRGKQAQELLEKAGIVTNRNTVPYDKHSPFNPSGLRLGTPAVTTRGMKEKEMRQISEYINRVVAAPKEAENIKKEVKRFCSSFPLS